MGFASGLATAFAAGYNGNGPPRRRRPPRKKGWKFGAVFLKLLWFRVPIVIWPYWG